MGFLLAPVLACLLALSVPELAAAGPFQAGVGRLTVPDPASPFDVLVWYPTPDPEAPWQAGPFPVAASRNAALADGPPFPLVLLSHGRGGGPLSHRDLAAGLAREGFIVAVPVHVGDAVGHPRSPTQAQILMDRPRQAKQALDAVLANPRFAGRADPDRVGMIGFSAGGYTALVLAGARPSRAVAAAYCAGEGIGDRGSCPPLPEDAAGNAVLDGPRNDESALDGWTPPTEPRLKALVLLDPLGVLFDRPGLASVRVPTLLLHPEDDSFMKAGPNAAALARGLPRPPEQAVVPGAHFVFIDPCPGALMAEEAFICEDAPGVDRPAVHRRIAGAVAGFLRRHL